MQRAAISCSDNRLRPRVVYKIFPPLVLPRDPFGVEHEAPALFDVLGPDLRERLRGILHLIYCLVRSEGVREGGSSRVNLGF